MYPHTPSFRGEALHAFDVPLLPPTFVVADGQIVKIGEISRRFCALPDSVQARRFARVANNAERFETRGSVKAVAQSAT
jgi:hypothetical protein